MQYKIDFFKTFELEQPTAGLVQKVTSHKGIKRTAEDGSVTYALHTDLKAVYEGKASILDAGVYLVTDVYIDYSNGVVGTPHWNHYLFIIEEDGAVYPIKEFVDQTDSSWVKNAIKPLKRIFAGEKLPAAKLTILRDE